jgi:hypothetical protein
MNTSSHKYFDCESFNGVYRKNKLCAAYQGESNDLQLRRWIDLKDHHSIKVNLGLPGCNEVS